VPYAHVIPLYPSIQFSEGVLYHSVFLATIFNLVQIYKNTEIFLIIPWSLDFIEIIFKIKILASQKTHRSCYKARIVTASWEE